MSAQVKRHERIVGKHAGGRSPAPEAETLVAWHYAPQDTETRLNHYLSGPVNKASLSAEFVDINRAVDGDFLTFDVTPKQRRRLTKKLHRNGF
jgi:hypothetical protein